MTSEQLEPEQLGSVPPARGSVGTELARPTAASHPVAEQGPRLPPPPGAVRRFWSRHPRVTDLALALGCATPGVADGVHALLDTPKDTTVVALVLAVLGSGILMFRRQRPLTVYVVVANTLMAGLFLPSVIPIAAAVALYGVARYRSNRDAWVAFGATMVLLLSTAYLRIPARHPPMPLVPAMMLAVAVLVSVNRNTHQRYLEMVLDRARQLEQDRDRDREAAAAAERARIARDIHDIVAHALTVVVTMADGAAAVVSSDATRAAGMMNQVADSGRYALGDLRRMLGVLASAGAGVDEAPQPDLAQLPALLDAVRTTGLRVGLTSTGSPPQDPGYQLTIYRILQEALTNAARYAGPGTSVTVTLVFDPARTVITIVDDGHTTAGRIRGSGRGIVGMKERAALYGGTVDAGRNAHGGWTVEIALPGTTSTQR